MPNKDFKETRQRELLSPRDGEEHPSTTPFWRRNSIEYREAASEVLSRLPVFSEAGSVSEEPFHLPNSISSSLGG